MNLNYLEPSLFSKHKSVPLRDPNYLRQPSLIKHAKGTLYVLHILAINLALVLLFRYSQILIYLVKSQIIKIYVIIYLAIINTAFSYRLKNDSK